MYRNNRPGMGTIVQTVIRWLRGPILLFGLYIIMYGHEAPGGGFGGAAIALIDTDEVPAASQAVAAAYADRNYPPATMFTVVPSAGAQRIA